MVFHFETPTKCFILKHPFVNKKLHKTMVFAIDKTMFFSIFVYVIGKQPKNKTKQLKMEKKQ